MLAAAEQESLLLRQMVALRQSGLSHEQALASAAAGLPPGPLAVRVSAARRALTAGTPSEADPLLTTGTTPVAALSCAAQAIDVGLSADAALATTRLYAAIALAGPLVIGCGLAWLVPDLFLILGEDAGAQAVGWGALSGLQSLLKFAGLPAALIVAMMTMYWKGASAAPGVAQLRRAATFLDAAARGGQQLPALNESSAQAYFDIRQQQVGAARAAEELAAQLRLEGNRRAQLFRHLAPPVAAVGAIILLAPVLVLFFLPVFSMAAM